MSSPPVPTSHDVARLAGVSQPTVSRAMRADPRVSEATRLAVMQAATKLGYVPSQRGRSLSTRSTGQIALIVPGLQNQFYLDILNETHQRLESAGRRMIVLTSLTDDATIYDQLMDGSVDGAIITSVLLTSSLPQRLTNAGFPFVLLSRVVDDPPSDACSVDNVLGGRLAARELISLGHREFAALFGPRDTSTGRDRADGFLAELADHGFELGKDRTRTGPYDVRFGAQGARDIYDSGATALFCINDLVAIGALNALHQLGVSVPKQMSVIGFDDIDMASWEMFRLTTVHQDNALLVRRALELLFERMASPQILPPRRVVVEPSLMRRSTHGPPPTHD